LTTDILHKIQNVKKGAKGEGGVVSKTFIFYEIFEESKFEKFV